MPMKKIVNFVRELSLTALPPLAASVCTTGAERNEQPKTGDGYICIATNYPRTTYYALLL